MALVGARHGFQRVRDTYSGRSPVSVESVARWDADVRANQSSSPYSEAGGFGIAEVAFIAPCPACHRQVTWHASRTLREYLVPASRYRIGCTCEPA